MTDAHPHGAHDHDHTDPPSDVELRVKALESLLVEKGLAESAEVDAIIDTSEHKVGPRNGAAIVARAWSDPAFKRWLLEDGTAAIASTGYIGTQAERPRAVVNTDDVHNLVGVHPLLAEVNVIADPAIRTTVWANKADAIVETYYVPD